MKVNRMPSVRAFASVIVADGVPQAAAQSAGARRVPARDLETAMASWSDVDVLGQ